ncbi:MAG TPA: hypothetical protein VIY86_09750, partial [Pirellulaceae bacterium]
MVPTQEQFLRNSCQAIRQSVTDGNVFAVESVLSGHADLAQDEEAVLELIYAEFTAREELGDTPTDIELATRFPHLRSRIDRLLRVHEAFQDSQHSTVRAGEMASTVDLQLDAFRRRQGTREVLFERVGPYELHELIGQGGMGVVYRALQTGLDRFVALKIIHKSAGDLEGHRRFRAEAKAAAMLQHPNIVPVHEVGEDPDCLYL